MYIDPTLLAWHDEWKQELVAARRSPTTIKTQSAAIYAFLQWAAELPDPLTASSLSFTVLEHYIEYLRDGRVRIQQMRHAAATSTGTARHKPPSAKTRGKQADRHALQHSTIRGYIGSLTRWLQWLIDEKKLAAIPDRHGQPMRVAKVRDLLERQLNKPKQLVAPRMPDLRRLPAYYHLRLDTFLSTHGVPGPKPLELHREYLNILRNRAFIATLFSSGARIAEALSLDVSVVQDDGQIADLAPISGKGRKERSLRLDAVARDWLAAYLQARAASYPHADALFISHGPKANGKCMSALSGWRAVKEAASWLAEQRQNEGAPKQEVKTILALSPHDLRHFFAQALLDAKVDYKDIAALLGHSTTAVTERVYARVDEAHAHATANAHAARPILNPDDPTFGE